MKIWMIWATDGDDYWPVEIYDDESRNNNRDGWDHALQDAYREYGDDKVRILTTDINRADVEDAFRPVQIKSTSTQKETA